MKTFPVIVERCRETGYLIGYVPGVPGAHTQAESFEELEKNMREVLQLVLKEKPDLTSDFVGLYSLNLQDA